MKFKVINEVYYGKMEGFEELKNGDQFIYSDGTYDNFAIKIDDETALFLNARNRWIEAKKYTNMLSIGTISTEYDSVKEYLERWK